MPNFLGWAVNEQTNEFGAHIQLNAHTFQPQPDGRVLVTATPRTEWFSGERMTKMAETAGPKSKGFWEDVAAQFQTHHEMHANKLDIGVSHHAVAPVAPKPALDLGVTAPTLA